MTHKDIITKLANECFIEQIINNIGKEEDEDNKRDLAQDLYIELLSKDPQMIEELYDNNQLNYYIIRIVINNIRSKNSKYYYMYKKNQLKHIDIDKATI